MANHICIICIINYIVLWVQVDMETNGRRNASGSCLYTKAMPFATQINFLKTPDLQGDLK